jgi:hypothetical protein
MNRIWKKFSILIIFLLLQIICYNHLQSEVADSNDKITNEEYEIFTLVIDSLFVKPDTKQIVICDSTLSPCYEFLANRIPKSYKSLSKLFKYRKIKMISKILANDFYIQNTRKYFLNKNAFKFNLPCTLLTNRNLTKNVFDSIICIDSDCWKLFYSMYPKAQGITTVSRVGFNNNKNQAILYVDVGRGYLDAVSYFILLEKKYGIWRIKKKILWARS